MKGKIIEAVLIVVIAAGLLLGTQVNSEASELSDKLIRLHVVAASDDAEDQKLKLMVRDSVLEVLEPILCGVADREGALDIVTTNEDLIVNSANCVLSDAGCDDRVRVSLCREKFPTTEYDSFSLPAGEYMSLRIKIGEGKGHNWWCVVFPPVCTAGALDEKSAAAMGLTSEEFKLIVSEEDGYVIKFRIMELIAELKSLFKYGTV